jgi:ElaB/YqjD/DUF883 family membrane-anchored ribosome-binding protein
MDIAMNPVLTKSVSPAILVAGGATPCCSGRQKTAEFPWMIIFLLMKGQPMTTSHDTAQPSNSVETLRGQAQEAGQEVAHKVQQVGKEMVEKAQQLGEQGKEIVSEYYQQGRQQAAAWEDQLQQQIREKPIQSLFIAGGIGLLLGLLCRRR